MQKQVLEINANLWNSFEFFGKCIPLLPGSKSSSRGGTPSPVVHNYSLRQRKSNQTFNGFSSNPILEEESPDTFGKVVANLARQAKVLTLCFQDNQI